MHARPDVHGRVLAVLQVAHAAECNSGHRVRQGSMQPRMHCMCAMQDNGVNLVTLLLKDRGQTQTPRLTTQTGLQQWQTARWTQLTTFTHSSFTSLLHTQEDGRGARSRHSPLPTGGRASRLEAGLALAAGVLGVGRDVGVAALPRQLLLLQHPGLALGLRVARGALRGARGIRQRAPSRRDERRGVGMAHEPPSSLPSPWREESFQPPGQLQHGKQGAAARRLAPDQRGPSPGAQGPV